MDFKIYSGNGGCIFVMKLFNFIVLVIFYHYFFSSVSMADNLSSIEINKNYQVFKLDVTHDEKTDLIIEDTENDKLLIFVNDDNKYHLDYKGDDFSADGIYNVINIVPDNNSSVSFAVIKYLNGAGGQIIKDFVKYENHRASIIESITFNPSVDSDGNAKYDVCIEDQKCKTYVGVLSNKMVDNYPYVNVDIQYITVQKQFFYREPSLPSKTKLYVIKGDKVKVIKSTDNSEWLYVEYNGKKDFKYWIPAISVK